MKDKTYKSFEKQQSFSSNNRCYRYVKFTDMKSNIFDKNGIEVCIGDTLIFPYVDPMGKLHNEEDFRKTVVFKYGCFGYETETRFIPLMDWMETETGDYVSNCGNKVVYTEKYPFWVVR